MFYLPVSSQVYFIILNTWYSTRVATVGEPYFSVYFTNRLADFRAIFYRFYIGRSVLRRECWETVYPINYDRSVVILGRNHKLLSSDHLVRCPSRWSRGLRRASENACLLGTWSLSLMSVVCCLVEVSASGRRNRTDCVVYKWV